MTALRSAYILVIAVSAWAPHPAANSVPKELAAVTAHEKEPSLDAHERVTWEERLPAYVLEACYTVFALFAISRLGDKIQACLSARRNKGQSVVRNEVKAKGDDSPTSSLASRSSRPRGTAEKRRPGPGPRPDAQRRAHQPRSPTSAWSQTATPRAECDTLARAVRTGRAAELPRLFDALEARWDAMATRSSSKSSAAPCSGVRGEATTRHLLAALRACASSRCFQEALTAYDHMATRMGDGTPAIWSLLLYSAVEAKELERCDDFFASLCSFGPPSSHDFVNIVRFHALRRDVAGLRRRLLDLQAQGIKMDGLARNRALAACTAGRVLDLAECLAHQPGGPPMDTIAYNTLMKGYSQTQVFTRCFELYYELRRNDLQPSEVTFGILLDACVDSGDFDRVREIFKDMESSGLRVNVVHFTTFIKGLVAAGRLKDAVGVLEEMQQSLGMLPDLVTYSTVLKAYADRGCVVEAKGLLEQMIKQGVVADTIVFNIVLTSCCNKVVPAPEVLALFHWLLRRGLEPCMTTVSILMKALSKAEAWAEALELLESAPQRYGIWPEARVFVQLAQGCATVDRGAEALQAYACMLRFAARQGRCVEEQTSARMLRYCAATGHGEAASRLHAELLRRGGALKPNEVDSLVATRF